MADQQPGEVIIPIERNESAQPPEVAEPMPVYDAKAQSGPINVPPPSDMPPSEPLPQVPAPVEPTVPPTVQPAQPMPTPAPTVTERTTPQAPAYRGDGISWQSAEYFAHDKDSSWYGAMVLGSIFISIIVYILNRDIITSLIILFSLVGLTYFSGRKPREQQFSVSGEGIQVGRNYYAFHDFRCFSVTEDPSSVSVILIPLKRFMPAVNIFVPAEYEEKVVSFISDILPFEQRKADVVDNFMRRIKF